MRASRSGRGKGRAAVPFVAALLLRALPGLAAPAPTPPPAPQAAPVIEGTWELESLTLPSGEVLRPPRASGVIVVEGEKYLSASYMLAGAERKVGSLWEGKLVVANGRFTVTPAKGMRHDSAASPPNVVAVPPKSEGTVTATPDGFVFTREDGGTVTWDWRARRRIQQEPDGTVIVHTRISLVPTVPPDLPGR